MYHIFDIVGPNSFIFHVSGSKIILKEKKRKDKRKKENQQQ